MKLECRYLGTECEETVEDDDQKEFVLKVYRHLEDKHEQFLLDWIASKPNSELIRFIKQFTER